MRNIYKLTILMFLILGLTSASAKDVLTKQMVTNLLSKMDKTTVDLDAKALGDLLSDNVLIKIVLPKQNGKNPIVSPNKKQYISLLKQAWAKNKNYKYQRYNVNIEISNNKAITSFNAKESIQVENKTIDTYLKDQMLIEIINGKALITKVVSFLQK